MLTLDELKSFVDQRWPAQPRALKEGPGDSAEGVIEAAYHRRASPLENGDRLRNLLARRLTRANRWCEARPYYFPKCLPAFDKLCVALSKAQNSNLAPEERAQGYFDAAIITRESGLELLGTEVEPDWSIHGGNYQEGITVADRATLRGTNFLAPSAEEIERGARHAADPELRWHYRYTAGALAAQGARLMRDAEMPAVPERNTPGSCLKRLEKSSGSTITPPCLRLNPEKESRPCSTPIPRPSWPGKRPNCCRTILTRRPESCAWAARGLRHGIQKRRTASTKRWCDVAVTPRLAQRRIVCAGFPGWMTRVI